MGRSSLAQGLRQGLEPRAAASSALGGKLFKRAGEKGSKWKSLGIDSRRRWSHEGAPIFYFIRVSPYKV
jgi:hypothetical protein